MTFIPAGVALLSMVIVWLYPLNTRRVNDIVAQLSVARRGAADVAAADAAAGSAEKVDL